MEEFYKPALGFSIGFTLILALFFLLISWQISLAIAVGTIFSIVHFMLLSVRYTTLLSRRKINYFTFVLSFFGNFLILMIPFALAIGFPQFLNLFGIAVGLFIPKVAIYVVGLLNKKKERSDEYEVDDSE